MKIILSLVAGIVLHGLIIASAIAGSNEASVVQNGAKLSQQSLRKGFDSKATTTNQGKSASERYEMRRELKRRLAEMRKSTIIQEIQDNNIESSNSATSQQN